jgi:hypothetical protein
MHCETASWSAAISTRRWSAGDVRTFFSICCARTATGHSTAARPSASDQIAATPRDSAATVSAWNRARTVRWDRPALQAMDAGQQIDQHVPALAIELGCQNADPGGVAAGMSERGNDLFCHQILRDRHDRNGFRRTLHGPCQVCSTGHDDIRPRPLSRRPLSPSAAVTVPERSTRSHRANARPLVLHEPVVVREPRRAQQPAGRSDGFSRGDSGRRRSGSGTTRCSGCRPHCRGR